MTFSANSVLLNTSFQLSAVASIAKTLANVKNSKKKTVKNDDGELLLRIKEGKKNIDNLILKENSSNRIYIYTHSNTNCSEIRAALKYGLLCITGRSKIQAALYYGPL